MYLIITTKIPELVINEREGMQLLMSTATTVNIFIRFLN